MHILRASLTMDSFCSSFFVLTVLYCFETLFQHPNIYWKGVSIVLDAASKIACSKIVRFSNIGISCSWSSCATPGTYCSLWPRKSCSLLSSRVSRKMLDKVLCSHSSKVSLTAGFASASWDFATLASVRMFDCVGCKGVAFPSPSCWKGFCEISTGCAELCIEGCGVEEDKIG